MTAFKLERATTWEQVEQAANAAKSCIAPERGNWQKARLTWMAFGEGDPAQARCIYYRILEANYPSNLVGYLRLLKVSVQSSYVNSDTTTWAVDYCSPFHYRIVAEAKKQLQRPMLVKSPGVDDSVLANPWPRITVAIPALDSYPYHNQYSHEATWLVVL